MEGHDNHGSVAPAEPGLLLDGFEPPIPRSVKLEGAAFSLRGRVGIAAARDDHVHAVIRAGRPYDVNVSITGAGKVLVACDCVSFHDDAAVCRHIWATLITVQNGDLLRIPGTRGTRKQP